MNKFKTFLFRTYQFFLNKIILPFIPFKEPILIKGPNSILKSVDILLEKDIHKVFVFCSASLNKLGKIDPLLDKLGQHSIVYVFYDGVSPNPDFSTIEYALDVAVSQKVEAFIAIGGGSNIDTAKVVAAAMANKIKDLNKLKGLMKVKKKLPLFIAIPTTAGSGSEASIAAVITNDETKEKFAITDPHLLPTYAILDETLLESVPGRIIAETGMDALTHAIEAYIGGALTKKTKKAALDSINIIYHNLLGFYEDPHNLAAAKNMQYASYSAGLAFTRSYVGYVHALAHQLGGRYNVHHGLANAVLLPLVLEAYGPKVEKRLGEIAKMLELCHPETKDHDASLHMINWIKIIRQKLRVPSTLNLKITNDDLDAMAEGAYKESNPLYPVPRIMDKEELKNIYLKAIKEKKKDD